jgi:hypothetical protein
MAATIAAAGFFSIVIFGFAFEGLDLAFIGFLAFGLEGFFFAGMKLSFLSSFKSNLPDALGPGSPSR